MVPVYLCADASRVFCPNAMYVCICNAITETDLRRSVDAGARTLEDLQLDTGVASCCGTCASAAEALLATHCPGHAVCASRLTRFIRPAAAAAAVPAAPASLPGFAPVRWVSRAPHAMPKAA